MLEVEGLTFSYPDGKEILRGVSFSLAKGARIAIVGENGSGKTTLARLLCGLLGPTGGTVSVDGLRTADAASIFEVRRKVGLVFQDPEDQIVETTVEREIGFGPRNLGLGLDGVERRVDDALRTFGIERLRRRPTNLLSAGEKQTVAIAAVFAMEPEYVVLDESTSLLDSKARREVVGAVERLLATTGAGLVFITMRLEDVWLCNQVMFLKEGRQDFCGGKADFLGYLRERELPLYGTPLLVREIARSLPGVLTSVAGSECLCSDCLVRALKRFGGGAKGGNPCP